MQLQCAECHSFMALHGTYTYLHGQRALTSHPAAGCVGCFELWAVTKHCCQH
jgi:hypothetical protein